MQSRLAPVVLLLLASRAVPALAAPGAEPADRDGDDSEASAQGDEGSATDEPEEEQPKRRASATAPEDAEAPETDEPLPDAVPPARDLLGGHLVLGLGAAWGMPSGELSRGVSASERGGSGAAFALDMGLGVGRSVVLGAWGAYAAAGSAADCERCEGRSVSGGGFVRYHLVQGVRFDPWLLAGIGFGSATYDTPQGERSYSGPEWLRLAVGGDWYAWSGLGFGPWLEASASSFTSLPGGERDAQLHWTYRAGARLVLDVPGK